MKPKLSREQIRLLGLSGSELAVLEALRAGHNTPLLISEHIKVSRPAIYEILDRLHKRGLIKSNIRGGKKHWSQSRDKDIEQELYSSKRQLLGIEEGIDEVRGLSDSTVVAYHGGEAIRGLLHKILKDNKNQRLYGIQGDTPAIGWSRVVGIERTNELNRIIKQNNIIVEAIVPYGWFERQIKLLGKKWAEDFEGRASATHIVDEKYFQHGGQIWIFKNSLYLIAMNEEIIIEVRNSEIQKLILSMFRFIQDNSQKIDVNALLRELIAKDEIKN